MKPLAARTSATDYTAALVSWDIATVAALKAIESINPRDKDGTRVTEDMLLPQGREERVRSLSGRLFVWHPTSELDGDDQLVIIPNDRNSAVDTDLADDLAGRWLAVPGQVVDLALAIAYTLADGATIYTMPTGSALFLAPIRRACRPPGTFTAARAATWRRRSRRRGVTARATTSRARSVRTSPRARSCSAASSCGTRKSRARSPRGRGISTSEACSSRIREPDPRWLTRRSLTSSG
jgi:hypothetical protein